MAHDEKNGREKKVTGATTDAPQEEFIEAENIPSVPEKPAKKDPGNEHDEPLRK